MLGQLPALRLRGSWTAASLPSRLVGRCGRLWDRFMRRHQNSALCRAAPAQASIAGSQLNAKSLVRRLCSPHEPRRPAIRWWRGLLPFLELWTYVAAKVLVGGPCVRSRQPVAYSVAPRCWEGPQKLEPHREPSDLRVVGDPKVAHVSACVSMDLAQSLTPREGGVPCGIRVQVLSI